MCKPNEEHIYLEIKQAIIQQKLRPNVQLVEDVLADTFGVSRTPVRNVLRRLATEKLVNVVPYKGTFVSCPTIQEAKDIFEMRRVLEAAIIRKVCGKTSDDKLKELEKMLEDEVDAQEKGNIYEALNITRDFHMKIAEMSGNQYFYQHLEELVALTYVIIAFYGSNQMFCNDHKEIFEAINKRDVNLAEKLMVDHLHQLERCLNFDERITKPKGLAEIFSQRGKI
ncbi:GntR family transcriptional regulator [Lederbergia panacisoli]|uniref:GntR family transcriptional regulator n=1 Tax=Lederbergia panacisoli TaxID=1255251 RepID=UPI00214C3525|nr:GntR family transcriptional regulator [Lederbergia panacisoli]MCR2823300.1 GntR family transcriptional regulator [Lederbergia panacisoli]